ncbi:MAG: SDR family NAD(P)-dependent oxidoreductase [Pseudomonadota bacterium]
MNTLFPENGVAWVTGAASGIGRAAARRLAAEGQRLALIDLPGPKLDAITEELGAAGAKVEADLGQGAAAFCAAAEAALGAPDLLMNNAASRAGRGMDAPLDEWRVVMDVNFWAVVEASRLMAPKMAARGGRIVNTGSKQGITNPPGHPIYNVAKSAVKTFTEALEHELRGAEGGQTVSAHLLIPGWTTVGDAEHNPGAWMPEQVIDFMIEALRNGDFYILCPDDETSTDQDHKRVAWGAGDITENRPPLSRWHPDWAGRAKDACS